ncbi:MAG: hypothetical protein ACR2L1_03985, partial [Pyrinomonadaceae bacterium]
MKPILKNPNRLKFLLVTICLGLIAGIVFSHELWFPVFRTFPRAPLVFGLPEHFVVPFEWLFSSILFVSLIAVVFSRQPKVFLAIVIFSLLLLAFFDQTRMQPWAYEYLIIFAVFYWHDWENPDNSAIERTIGLGQIVVAGLYVWSGIQKMNYNFAHDILPFLLIPVQNLFPTFELPLGFPGIAIPLTEFLIGCGLLFRRTRNAAVCFAVSMHTIILSLLIAKDYNSIVWVWNLTLIFAVVFAFWNNNVSLKEVVANEKFAPRKIMVFAFAALPFLNFFGYWDSFLSGAYYSGNVEIPAIRISEEVYEKLPESARAAVFRTQNGNRQILPLFEWAINDTNAPVYLEERVFRKITLEICGLADDKSQVELVIKKRPAILDGRYEVT